MMDISPWMNVVQFTGNHEQKEFRNVASFDY